VGCGEWQHFTGMQNRRRVNCIDKDLTMCSEMYEMMQKMCDNKLSGIEAKLGSWTQMPHIWTVKIIPKNDILQQNNDL
jgi:hypothetical protein